MLINVDETEKTISVLNYETRIYLNVCVFEQYNSITVCIIMPSLMYFPNLPIHILLTKISVVFRLNILRLSVTFLNTTLIFVLIKKLLIKVKDLKADRLVT